jgi:hypothetical protein
MKIGNIVSTTNINVSEDFNVVQSLDDIIQGLPTLIIGWDYVRSNYPDYDVIEKKLGDNLFWTFKKTENRGQHEEDLYNFVEKSYKNLIINISYVYIDPVLFSLRKMKKVLRKITSTPKIIAYQHGSMLYIYGDNIIFGIDLNFMEFIGINQTKIKNKIKDIGGILLSENQIFIEYKKRVENLDNQVKYIPFLYSIENG